VAALIYSVEHFEVYLLGNEFTGLLYRSLLKIRLEHKLCTVNTKVDALSRALHYQKDSLLNN